MWFGASNAVRNAVLSGRHDVRNEVTHWGEAMFIERSRAVTFSSAVNARLINGLLRQFEHR
jgi:hypothetical protein